MVQPWYGVFCLVVYFAVHFLEIRVTVYIVHRNSTNCKVPSVTVFLKYFETLKV